MNKLLLNRQEIESLKIVIDYMWKDEKRHYEEYEPEDREGHIYEHIKIINDALQAV